MSVGKKLLCLNLALLLVLTLLPIGALAEWQPSEDEAAGHWVDPLDGVALPLAEESEAPEEDAVPEEPRYEPVPKEWITEAGVVVPSDLRPEPELPENEDAAEPITGSALARGDGDEPQDVTDYYIVHDTDAAGNERSGDTYRRYSLPSTNGWSYYDRDLRGYSRSWTCIGWSRRPGGFPEDLPGYPVGEVHIYPVWSARLSHPERQTEVAHATSFSDLVSYSLENVTVDLAIVSLGDTRLNPAKADAGEGWSWDGETLTLSDGYSGAPIIALRGLILRIDGNVTLWGSNGPAIAAPNGRVVIDFIGEGSLLLEGARDASAVRCKQLSVFCPARLTALGSGTAPAVSADLVQLSLNESHGVRNRCYQGPDEITLTEIQDYNGSEPVLVLRPPELTVTLDANGGVFPTGGGTVTLPVNAWDPLPAFPTPVNGGQKLAYWNSRPDGWNGNVWFGGETYRYLNENTTFYAIWQDVQEPTVQLNGRGRSLGYYGAPGLFRPIWYLHLENGQVTMPGFNGYGWSADPEKTMRIGVVDDLYWVGETYALEPGTVLYPVSSDARFFPLMGNGHRTPDTDSDRALITYQYYASGSSLSAYTLRVYDLREVFDAPGEVLSGFNTAADGSGEPVSIVNSTNGNLAVYAQWSAAPAGSVLLYDLHQPDRVSVVAQDRFNPAGNYGCVWNSHVFRGWAVHDDESRTPVASLAEAERALDDYGRYVLKAVWEAVRLTLVEPEGVSRDYEVDDLGTVKLPNDTLSLEKARQGSPVLAGWNEAADGSGIWHYPGERLTLTEPVTLYAQYITPPSGPWVLLELPKGGPRCAFLAGTQAENGMLLAELPAGEWTRDGTNGNLNYQGGRAQRLLTYRLYRRVETGTPTAGFRLFMDGGYLSNYCDVYRTASRRTYDATHGDLVTYAAFPDQESFTVVPEGMTLAGWTHLRDGLAEEELYESGTHPDGTIPFGDYVARWYDGEGVRVYLDRNLGGGAEIPYRMVKPGEDLILPALARSGYRFLGWMGDDGSLRQPGETFQTWSDTGMTAKWEAVADANAVPVAVPPTMAEEQQQNGDAQVLLALYYPSGRLYTVRYVSAGELELVLNNLPEPGMRYEFLCADGDYTPLLNVIQGSVQ